MFDFHRMMNTLALAAILTVSLTPQTLFSQQLEVIEVYSDLPLEVHNSTYDMHFIATDVFPNSEVIYGELQAEVPSTYETIDSSGGPFEGEVINVEVVSDVAVGENVVVGESSQVAHDYTTFPSDTFSSDTDQSNIATPFSVPQETPTTLSPSGKTAYTHQAVVNALSSELDKAVKQLLEIHSKPSPYAPKLARIEKQLKEISELSQKRSQALHQLNQTAKDNVKRFAETINKKFDGKFDESKTAISKLQETVQQNSHDLKDLTGEINRASKATNSGTHKSIVELQSNLQRESQGLRELIIRVQQSVSQNAPDDEAIRKPQQEDIALIQRSVSQQNESLKRLAEAIRKSGRNNRVAKQIEQAAKQQTNEIQQLTEALGRLQSSVDRQSEQLATTATLVTQLQESVKQNQTDSAATTATTATTATITTDKFADQLDRQSNQLQSTLKALESLRNAIHDNRHSNAEAHAEPRQHSQETDHKGEDSDAHSNEAKKSVAEKEETLKQLIKRVKKATE